MPQPNRELGWKVKSQHQGCVLHLLPLKVLLHRQSNMKVWLIPSPQPSQDFRDGDFDQSSVTTNNLVCLDDVNSVYKVHSKSEQPYDNDLFKIDIQKFFWSEWLVKVRGNQSSAGLSVQNIQEVEFFLGKKFRGSSPMLRLVYPVTEYSGKHVEVRRRSTTINKAKDIWGVNRNGFLTRLLSVVWSKRPSVSATVLLAIFYTME